MKIKLLVPLYSFLLDDDAISSNTYLITLHKSAFSYSLQILYRESDTKSPVGRSRFTNIQSVVKFFASTEKIKQIELKV